MSSLTQAAAAGHRICIIAAYIGKLPGWISVWLRSCEFNPDFHFLLITDRPGEVPFCPKNVTVVRLTLAELRDRISGAVGFDVALAHGYKLCDYKPIYGLALADLLSSYDFWGHTDVDLYFGQLSSFIPPGALANSVRLYHRGHLSLFRNNQEGNSLYKLPHPSVDYRRVFQTQDYCHFDETPGIDELVRFNNLPIYEDNFAFADIIPKFPSLKLSRPKLNHKHQAFVFVEGVAEQVYIEDGQVKHRPFMYVHLQKRNMPPLNPAEWRNASQWAFTPQGFVLDVPSSWDANAVRRLSRPNYEHALSYAWKRLKRKLDTAKQRTS